MSHNSFGHLFRVTTWGESHGPAIGCVVDGCPPGINLTEADIQPFLDKRRPGQSKFTTQRQEPDQVRILSGVFEGRTTGTPIALQIENTDQRSRDYGNIAQSYRPGHADLTYDLKYGIRDYRGGGRASARETACRVAAGAIARKILGDGVRIRGALVQMGPHGIDRANWDWAETDRNPFFAPDAAATKAGAIGVDFNAEHLAIAIIGADGNPRAKDLRRINFAAGPSTDQQRDAMGCAVRELVDIAIERQLPIVIEDLDFQKKKTELREIGQPGYARMLSGLGVAMFRQMLVTRAHRHGVRVVVVSPSFTSFQGRVRYQRQLGISVHHAAAIEIARRGLRLGESAKPWAGRVICVPSGQDHVTFRAPDRMPGKHVWSWWGKMQGQWRAVQKAHAKALRKQRDVAVALTEDASLSADGDFLSALTFASSTPVDAREGKRFRPSALLKVA